MLPSSTILLVEDSLPDYLITKSTLKAAGLVNPIKHCSTGQDTLDYLYRRGVHEQNSPRPTLIILDLTLPDMTGFDILKIIKKDENLKSIPVIVITGHDDLETMHKCYEAGADSYMVKPINFEGLDRSIKRIKSCYFELIFHGKV